MTTHQGAGAGQGIDVSAKINSTLHYSAASNLSKTQGAFILSSLLAHPLVTIETLPKVLEIYDAVRRPLGTDVVRRSNINGHLYEFSHPDFYDLAMDDPPPERLRALLNTKLIFRSLRLMPMVRSTSSTN